MQIDQQPNAIREQAAHQVAAETLATAVARLASQRNQLRDYRQRAEHSVLVNQALQAYRLCARLQAEPSAT